MIPVIIDLMCLAPQGHVTAGESGRGAAVEVHLKRSRPRAEHLKDGEYRTYLSIVCKGAFPLE